MNYLSEQGARERSDSALDFGDPRSEAETAADDIRCPLTHYGLIHVSGGDATVFLQGQLTNDIHQVTRDRSQLSAWCSPKGRVLTTLRVLADRDGYLLRLPAQRLTAVMARLHMFVMRADVKLADVSQQLAVIGVSGPGAAELVAPWLTPSMQEDGSVSRHGDLLLVSVGSRQRFEIYGPAPQLRSVWSSLADATAVGPAVWSLLDIRAGVAEIGDATADAFIPQMLNLDHLGAVSFSKGCYTGQEIVARTQYLGKLKRHLHRAVLESPQCPQPGSTLYARDNGQGGAEVGQVVTAACAGSSECELLAVVRDSDPQPHILYLGDADGPQVRIINPNESGSG